MHRRNCISRNLFFILILQHAWIIHNRMRPYYLFSIRTTYSLYALSSQFCPSTWRSLDVKILSALCSVLHLVVTRGFSILSSVPCTLDIKILSVLCSVRGSLFIPSVLCPVCLHSSSIDLSSEILFSLTPQAGVSTVCWNVSVPSHNIYTTYKHVYVHKRFLTYCITSLCPTFKLNISS